MGTLLIMVACAVFLLGFVPLLNSGHVIFASAWMVLWLLGCVIVFLRARK